MYSRFMQLPHHTFLESAAIIILASWKLATGLIARSLFLHQTLMALPLHLVDIALFSEIHYNSPIRAI